jgi:hypothetical protein
MKRFGLDVALIRILLVSVPFSCGPKTFYEPIPPARCGPEIVKYYDWTSGGGDGGTVADSGTVADGGGSRDGGLGPIPNFSSSQCGAICGSTNGCSPDIDNSGEPIVRCIPDCYGYGAGCGRRPAELPVLAQGSGDALAGYFEQAAYLEAASVHAFARLADELRAHGAPATLSFAAERAAADEVRHARVMARLARRYGGTPTLPPAGSRDIRPLAEVARENAVEGCVRETYGALIAWLQTTVAGDRQIQRAFRRIAADETAHAQLAWWVAKWCHSQLAPAARRAVLAAQQLAVVQLTHEIEVEPAAELVSVAGLPPRAVARRLVAEAERTLWS